MLTRAIGILLFSLWASSVEAVTLYVNNTGSPGCSDATTKAANSAASPWCTIGRAAWGDDDRTTPNAAEAASAGDTVNITAGSYEYTGVWSSVTSCPDRFDAVYNPTNDGTGSQPITFTSTGTVTLSAPNYGGPLIGSCLSDYIIWEGDFQMTEATSLAAPDTGLVVLNQCTGCGVDGITVDGDGFQWEDDNHNGVRVEACQSCFVRNSTLFNIRGNDNHNDAGVMLYTSDDTLIENNLIYEVGSSVFVKGTLESGSPQERTIVRFNLMYDCGECIVTSHSTDGRYYQNIIRDSFSGVYIFGEGAVPFRYPDGDWVYNNTIDNMSGACIQASGSVLADVLVWNNISTNCASANHYEGANFPASGAVLSFQHNVYFTFGNFGSQLSGNFSFATWQALPQDATSPAAINTNPLFANAATDDFRLCTAAGVPDASCAGASPAINLGRDPADGTTARNAGAYLTNDDCIGLESGCTPTPPASTIYRLRRVGMHE